MTLAVTTFSLRMNGIFPPFLLLLLPRRSPLSLALQKHQSHVSHGLCANCEYSSGYFFAPLLPEGLKTLLRGELRGFPPCAAARTSSGSFQSTWLWFL